MQRHSLRVAAGVLARVFLAWVACTNDYLMAVGPPPISPPSFWDGGVVMGVGRPDWVYYHVTNLPKNSVLYCPNYPDLPDAYPNWPRKRLERPILEQRDGQMVLRDPEVEKAREQEEVEREKAKEGLWSRLWRLVDVRWASIFPTSKPYQIKNYLFIPKIKESFIESNLFRYLPPDQFWQICSEDILLVSQDQSEETRKRLITEGRATHKIVLMVGKTPYSKTIHTVNFWQPWSVYFQSLGTENEGVSDTKNGQSKGTDCAIERIKNDIGKTSAEPNETGEQTMRKWRILRQTDLTTGAYVETLIDPEGEMKAPWLVPTTGSRFELWVMKWGTVRANLISCWSSFNRIPTFTEGNPRGCNAGQSMSRFSETGEESLVTGQRYRLVWTTGQEIQGDFGLQRWSEDEMGEIMGGTDFVPVNRSGDSLRIASSSSGSESCALWWRKRPEESWVLLSQFRQKIQPLPRVDLSESDFDHIPQTQLLELSGHYFPVRSETRILVRQSGHPILIREFSGKSDWDFSFCPEDVGMKLGRATLCVEYPAPWTSRSDHPETWKTLKALEVALNVIR